MTKQRSVFISYTCLSCQLARLVQLDVFTFLAVHSQGYLLRFSFVIQLKTQIVDIIKEFSQMTSDL